MRPIPDDREHKVPSSGARDRRERDPSLPRVPGTPVSPTDELGQRFDATCSPRGAARETLRSDYVFAEEFTPELMDSLLEIGFTERDFRLAFDGEGTPIITFHMVPGARDVMRRLNFVTDTEEEQEGETSGDEVSD